MNTDNNKTVIPLTCPLKGIIKIPADKSISHRAAIFSALVKEPVLISNFSSGADCKSTLSVLEQLGAEINFQSKNSLIISNKTGFKKPDNVLDAGNSGTTIRLMSGVLAGTDFCSVLTGDESLKKRPMSRIITPLRQMNADIQSKNKFNNFLRVKISILEVATLHKRCDLPCRESFIINPPHQGSLGRSAMYLPVKDLLGLVLLSPR